MTLLPPILSFSATALLIIIALLHLKRGEKGPQKSLFVITALLLAIVQLSLGSMLAARSVEMVLTSFKVLLACSILLPATGLPLFMVFGKSNERSILKERLPWLITIAVLAAGASILPVQLVVSKIHMTELGAFWGMTFSRYGKAVGVYLLVSNVAFLYFFENTYRAATIPDKVTLKYPLLGVLTASVIHFIVVSRIIAISALDVYFLTVFSCGVIALSLSFMYATFRYRLFNVNVYIGREVVSSVLTLVLSGLYLLSLALVSYLATRIGLSYDRITLIVLGVFAAFLFLAVLISGRARKRIRQFINDNFYLRRYDYRKEWREFARLMASSATISDFLHNLISFICETMFVRCGIIWVNHAGGRAAVYGFPEENLDSNLIEKIRAIKSESTVIAFKGRIFDKAGAAREDTQSECEQKEIHTVALIGHSDESHGFIALGEKAMGTLYTAEDREFLATIADQAALTFENLLMEERMLASRQMESFNRFTSFVIHDLKNAVGMLSMTAENARDNLGNVKFQEDAIDTVERSVTKMQGLINSLSAFKEPSPISPVDTDISSLIGDVTDSLKQAVTSKKITLEFRRAAPMTVRIDRTAIKRVMENLVLNALDATPGGGKVTIDIEEDGSNWIKIIVRDTGSGFDKDYMRDYLFHPFHSTKKSGLGIGLVLCKSLVEAHGGKLSIANRPEIGAEVTFTLPAQRAKRD